ncbi:hypothetical protein MACH09_44770 [Vibrio sp. MACH09]|uniref:DUF4381 domain-containing protein n=1 Tax=Vibrio sp. MACH09 TaxID=3025122 RepID=UPI002792918D|nr:DUF4381 domain-containing protein [Vibrio sp. MACH09]GLO63969.1 hypothetical protein MACH09_44770 [Vibrio sp. MACH09]
MSQQLSPELYAQLDKLRDIHLPDPISWWPLALGWWALLGVVLCFAMLGIIYLFYKRRSLKFVALVRLNELAIRYGETELLKLTLATEISVLLHRVVIRLRGYENAAETDEAWCRILSEGDNGMDEDIARYISQAPYRMGLSDKSLSHRDGCSPDTKTLVNAAEKWIRGHA